MALAGGALYLTLTTGVIQFAKNTSVNVAHQQLLEAFNHMEKDVHSSLSIPQLLNADLTPYTGTGSAAGIGLQRYSMGPFTANWANNGLSAVTIATGATKRPAAGQRIIFEDMFIEKDITAVTASGNNSVVTMDSSIWTAIHNMDLATIADKAGYVVFKPDNTTAPNGELRYYPNLSRTYAARANSGGSSTYTVGAGSVYSVGARVRAAAAGSITNYEEGVVTSFSGTSLVVAIDTTAGTPPGTGNINVYRVLAKGLRTATPFSFGTNPSSGAINPRALLAAITISDPTYNQRGYKALDLSMTFQLPYRGRTAFFP